MTPDQLHFTDSDEANALIAGDPLALLIGLVLDQQVTVQKAFAGPLVAARAQVGALDAAQLAATDLEPIFRERPAIHRFPASMAKRVAGLAPTSPSGTTATPRRVWTDAATAGELEANLAALPGFGEMKVTTLAAILAKRFGVAIAQPLVPDHPTLGDVDSAQALAEYQADKRARKAAARARGPRRTPWRRSLRHDLAGRAPARRAQPRPAARGARLRRHAGRHALPADPLRRPGRGPGELALWRRRAGGPRALAVARRPARPTGGHARGDDRVRGQRSHRDDAAADRPAMGRRGGRDGGVDRRAVARRARGGRRAGRCDRGPVRRAGPRDRGRPADELRAQPVARRRPPRRGAARLRDERAAAAAPARLPAAARGPRLVRHGERQVARADHARSTSRSPAITKPAATACARRPRRRASRSRASGRAR